LKSILITGCSSGIGYDSAKTLNKRGWRVFATCRKEEDCKRLREEGLESFIIDYQDEETIRSGLEHCLNLTGGTLNAVFNNGAYAIPGALEDLPTDGLKEIFQTNFFGYHELIRLTIPIMRKQGYGRIINCSSILGFIALQFRGAYTSTKFALEGFSDTLRVELRDSEIKVILIQPGPITSKIRENSVFHFEKWIDWEKSARATQYKNELIPRMYHSNGPDKFELLPSAVTKKLIMALESRNPKTRYLITTPTYFMYFLKKFLPTKSLDWTISKI